MLASNTMITLKPSTPVVKLSRHSGEMLNDVTCWKSALPWSRDANKNSVTANVKTDAASAVFRAGAPSMIRTAATMGQKIVNRTIRKNDEARMPTDERMMKLEWRIFQGSARASRAGECALALAPQDYIKSLHL